MAAGRQRWWRDYEQECAAWDRRAREDKRMMVILDYDGGIECKLVLWERKPIEFIPPATPEDFRVD